MFNSLAERLQWYLIQGKTECQVGQDYFPALKQTSYYPATSADEYTVCIWRIKLKPGLMYDNTSNPES